MYNATTPFSIKNLKHSCESVVSLGWLAYRNVSFGYVLWMWNDGESLLCSEQIYTFKKVYEKKKLY